MAEESHSIRSISWRDVLPFSVIFRSFRVAIHPSKLMLALFALVVVYLGGTLMDACVPESLQAVPDEITLYEQSTGTLDHDLHFRDLRKARIDQQKIETSENLKAIGKPDGQMSDLERAIIDQRDSTVASAKSIQERQDAYASAAIRIDNLHNGSVGLFKTFAVYELGTVYATVRAVRNANLIGPGGVTNSVYRCLSVGPSWALKYHPIFFCVYGIFFLVIWSVFGGAITRIAAVHYARDEKISVRQALAFSTSKFLSFVSAPIIPILIVLLIGLLIVVSGLIVNIPLIGPILVGALYILILAASFVITLVLLGLVGGLNLMYPTIAVEGSDSFDAISRSFSYLYARPWRLAFYTIVAIAYGAITYLFVRYFLYILLSVAHSFTGFGVYTHAPSATPLWQTMWPSPGSIGRLSYVVNWSSLSAAESIGATFLAFWVYLIVALLGAYAISFYFSVNTIIYYLMRREVDATELDDVYLEQMDDEFGDVIAKPSDIATDPAAPVVVVTPTTATAESGNPVPPLSP